MYAINNNLTVSKSLSNVVMMIFFIHNLKKFFEIIVQKQFVTFNVLMISIVKFFFNRTISANVDFLFKMIRVVFFFSQRWFKSEFRNKWFVFWLIFFFKFECARQRLKWIYVNVVINKKIDFCFFLIDWNRIFLLNVENENET